MSARPAPWSLDERRARVLLARSAEPYDEKVQALVADLGPVDLVGHALRDGRTPGGVGLERLAARLPRAAELDEDRVCRTLGARLLVPGDAEWPVALDALGAPPWCLWVRGPLALDEVGERSVAVVGARASTAYGEEVAVRLSFALAERGFTVVSGAAYGIDGAAHRAALSADGPTVAALAGGVDVPYPRANADLIAQIGARGLLLSETPPGGAPARMRFLARNRLIAALAAGTVVVEAGLRSGARSTAREARELGRHVMAVPGPVTSVMSAGCHEEIRAGAPSSPTRRRWPSWSAGSVPTSPRSSAARSCRRTRCPTSSAVSGSGCGRAAASTSTSSSCGRGSSWGRCSWRWGSWRTSGWPSSSSTAGDGRPVAGTAPADGGAEDETSRPGGVRPVRAPRRGPAPAGRGRPDG
ncbi:DNA protecting protein DprA [Ornithinimicrobium sp. CNJ-824]|uniref:DNA-processing protein DprA n=1 Tax=Ornithinimicrobium sp. CNJ-824 TaxID=1904966 RepID=UPI00095B61C8|nr:DNA protecting protein DprA [Ornithinimicrobium sp. CNJ-824]